MHLLPQWSVVVSVGGAVLSSEQSTYLCTQYGSLFSLLSSPPSPASPAPPCRLWVHRPALRPSPASPPPRHAAVPCLLSDRAAASLRRFWQSYLHQRAYAPSHITHQHMSSRADDDDDEFQALFGDCIDADAIEQIKNNDPNRDTYYADFEDDFEDVPNEAWERLGSYIAGNDHLRRIDFSECSLGVALFRGLAAKGGSLRGIVELSCEHNRGIDSTCFDLLLDSLEGGAIEILNVGSCSIQNPIALARCTLPNLRMLNLSRNGITDLPPEALAKLEESVSGEQQRYLAEVSEFDSIKSKIKDLEMEK